MKKGKPSVSEIRCSRKTPKSLEKLGRKEYRDHRTSLYGRNSDLLEVTVYRKSRA
jgi:hypothetical protein